MTEAARHLPVGTTMPIIVILTSSYHQLRAVPVIDMLLLIYAKMWGVAYDHDVSGKAGESHVCGRIRVSCNALMHVERLV